MARSRGTRGKIAYHADQLLILNEKQMAQLKSIYDLAQEQSPVINALLPRLVSIIDEVHTALVVFREKV